MLLRVRSAKMSEEIGNRTGNDYSSSADLKDTARDAYPEFGILTAGQCAVTGNSASGRRAVSETINISIGKKPGREVLITITRTGARAVTEREKPAGNRFH